MRINHDLISRGEIKGPSRLWLVRLMVAQIREATYVIAPPAPTQTITLDRYLQPFEDDHPDDVRDAREAARELDDLMKGPWVAGGTVWKEFTRIRNGVYHYAHNVEGEQQLLAAMDLAAEQPGAIVFSEDSALRTGAYPYKLSIQMTFPGASTPEAVQRFEDLMKPIEASIDPLRRVVERVEGLWITTRRPGVVTLTYPDGRVEPHDGRGLNTSNARNRT